MTNALLWTGPPAVGKTTAMEELAAMLPPARVRGFVTVQLLARGKRVGFQLQSFDGRTAVLAHKKIRSEHRVNAYGVDVAALDRIVAATLRAPKLDAIFLVDEIGKMECFSGAFVEALTSLLTGPQLVVATVAARGGGLIAAAKALPNAELWEITRFNRDSVATRAFEWLRARTRPPAG